MSEPEHTRLEPAAGTDGAAPAGRLWQLWRQGQRPDVRRFLAQAGPLGPRQTAAVLRVDQRERWQAGERIPAESYLREYGNVAGDPEAALDVVYGEFLVREDLGERPAAAEYVARFPALAGPLRLQLGFHEALEAPPTSSTSSVTQLTPADGAAPASSGSEPSCRGGLPAVAGYELLAPLGRGGMGVVYQAWQHHPPRQVALKMLSAGPWAEPEELARFKTEVDAIARLQHPHIVQIYEAGEEGGRPFFAMEFVDTGSLAAKLTGTPLPVRQAAELVQTVTRAIHHAHQRGIIHRDLTPGNILLQRKSEAPNPKSEIRNPNSDKVGGAVSDLGFRISDFEPKVTDFGLAKIVVGGGESLTQTGAVLGTPSYMAPEQACGHKGAVTTGTDVYGLGGILYALVTGRPPFQGRTALDILQQVVDREAEPPRRTNPRIDRDLETICLKCLQKDPQRRYGSAEALADDLGHWLAGEPISARPTDQVTRVWRWCRRHPAVAGLTAGLVVLLLFSVVILTVGLLVVGRQKAQLAVANDREHTAAQLAQQTIEAMTSEDALHFLETQKELRPEQRRFLEQAVAYYRQAVRQDAQGEEGKARQAAAYYRMAELQKRLGLGTEAVATYRAALEGYEGLAAEHPQGPPYRRGLARCHNSLGIVLAGLGKLPEAEKEYRAALAEQTRLAQELPRARKDRLELARQHNNLGVLLADLGKRPEAEKEYRAALSQRQRLAAEHPQVPAYRYDVAASHNNLGNLLRMLGRHQEAEKELHAALAEQTRLAADHPRTPEYRRQLAYGHTNLGILLASLGRRPEAEKEFRAAVAEQAQLVDRHPQVPAYRQELARHRNNLGIVLASLGKRPEAQKEHRAALAERERLAADYPRVPAYRQELAHSHINLGLVLADLGKRPQAQKEYRTAIMELAHLAAEYPQVPAYAVALGGTYCNFGNLLAGAERPGQALGAYDQAITTLERVLKKLGTDATARQNLRSSHAGRAGALAKLRRYTEAVREWDRALALADGSTRNHFRMGRAETLARAGDVARATDEAEEVLKAGPVNENLLYNVACVFALASAHATEPAQVKGYAGRAVALLGRAIAKGYKDVAAMRKDADLDPLRSRSDFKKLLAELEARKEPRPRGGAARPGTRQ
jgi:serine/threonine protein kinase